MAGRLVSLPFILLNTNAGIIHWPRAHLSMVEATSKQMKICGLYAYQRTWTPWANLDAYQRTWTPLGRTWTHISELGRLRANLDAYQGMVETKSKQIMSLCYGRPTFMIIHTYYKHCGHCLQLLGIRIYNLRRVTCDNFVLPLASELLK